MMKKFRKKSFNMQSKFGILSIAKHFKIIMIFISKLMFFFLLMYLKKHYKLDPCHYYTAPGLAWDACLKETKQNLELLKDYDMLMMFEQGIRGGITHISKRYAEANNKYMKNFDKTKPSTFIQYLDANNLYGWAMSQKLPTHGFKWIDVNKSKVTFAKKKRYKSRFHI